MTFISKTPRQQYHEDPNIISIPCNSRIDFYEWATNMNIDAAYMGTNQHGPRSIEKGVHAKDFWRVPDLEHRTWCLLRWS